MNFFKKLFSKKENKEKEPKKTFEEKYMPEVYPDHFVICESCKKPILPQAPRKTFPKGRDAKRYHMKCWRQLRKAGKKFQTTGKLM